MTDLGVVEMTPAGAQRLANIENNPRNHNVTIREYSAEEEELLGKNNSVSNALGSEGNLTYDKDGKPVPGSGVDSEIGFNPDNQRGPNNGPFQPEDSNLFHELGHAEHDAYGTSRAHEEAPPGGDPLHGYQDMEEWQNISGGINQPGGTQIPDKPQSPSENDYLSQRGFPLRRTDHGKGYATPEGKKVSDILGYPDF
jgi:hypothetical protein